MKKFLKLLVITGLALLPVSCLSMEIEAAPTVSTEKSTVKLLPKVMENGRVVHVYYRKGLSPEADRVRTPAHKRETLILKAGTVRYEGRLPLPCDILFEKDVPVTLRDGTVIYTDIFRPLDEEKHPALMAWSPYGKEIGGQLLDDVPGRAGVPQNATSGLEKFEGPDPAYWVAHGYVIINPDSRGAGYSEGNLNYWGSENAKDGKDTIEWAASQPWSNGKIGMTGNSWLTVSQWFIAGEMPKHLAAIAPWEGFVDHFRETANRGGIPNPVFPEAIFETFASKNLIEDQPRMAVTHPFLDDYWQDKIAKLENIRIPAYIAASWTNDVHTHGTFEGFRRISSREKWLRVHNTNEWHDYYTPAHVEDLRKFFDHYLKGENNGWEKTPKVRLSVLDPGHSDIVDRVEKDFPLKRAKYTKLYLNGNKNLSLTPAAQESTLSWDAKGKGTRLTCTFDKDTELTGYMNLHTWVEAEGSDDMDLHVTVQKLDEKGNTITNPMTGRPTMAEGYLRVSMRALDSKKSTPAEPVLLGTHEEKLQPGQIVPIDISIWPMAMTYHKGEKLALTIEPYQAPPKSVVPPFGKARVSVAKEGYTFDPKNPPEMITLGGNETEVAHPNDAVTPPPSRNKGKHILHLGGKYASWLLVPIVK